MKRLTVSKSVLEGSVTLSGAKNSALRLLAASLLTDDDITIDNFPSELLDVKTHIAMLEQLNKKCVVTGDSIRIMSAAPLKDSLEWEGQSIRNTLLIFGALLARMRKASVPLPGGCNLGDGKYDIHQLVLEQLGANIWEDNGRLNGEAPRGLVGAEVHLPIRSTGATENGIIAGALAAGTTVIWNPHLRPEILDLIGFIRSMGVAIEVSGPEKIVVHGSTSPLSGTTHRVIPDNVEAITYLIASVITNGDVEIIDFPYSHLEVPMIHLRESGARFFKGDNSLIVRGGRCYPVEMSTGPYPGINSDMQPLFAVYGLCSHGESRITDLRFPDRFGYSQELTKMGAELQVKNNLLIAKGGKPLHGGLVTALDLRCGAALILAGCVAEGKTEIENCDQILRGYENIDVKMRALGADIGFT